MNGVTDEISTDHGGIDFINLSQYFVHHYHKNRTLKPSNKELKLASNEIYIVIIYVYVLEYKNFKNMYEKNSNKYRVSVRVAQGMSCNYTHNALRCNNAIRCIRQTDERSRLHNNSDIYISGSQ